MNDIIEQPLPAACPQALPFAFPGVSGVGCAFTTALAGTFSLDPACLQSLPGKAPGSGSSTRTGIMANRRRVLDLFGLTQWVELHQIHGKDVIVEPTATPLEYASHLEGDGACTREARLALAVKTADCQPLLLTDTCGTAVAALHVGWRGNAMNFPETGLQFFCTQYRLDPAEVLAVRGPSLGPGAAEFVNFAQEWPSVFHPWFNEKLQTMDLWSLTRHQLVVAGMRPEHIFSLDLCTHSLPNIFFSHRRGHTGRQVSLIWLW